MQAFNSVDSLMNVDAVLDDDMYGDRKRRRETILRSTISGDGNNDSSNHFLSACPGAQGYRERQPLIGTIEA